MPDIQWPGPKTSFPLQFPGAERIRAWRRLWDTTRIDVTTPSVDLTDFAYTPNAAQTRRAWELSNASTLRRLANSGPITTGGQAITDCITADIATISSDLLFGDGFQLDFGAASPTPRMGELLDQTVPVLVESAEECAALGGVYFRVLWDAEMDDRPQLMLLQPDMTIPHWWGQKLIGAISIQTLSRVDGDKEGTVWRLVSVFGTSEGDGWTAMRLAKGSAEELGAYKPLDSHPKTAALKPNDSDGLTHMVEEGTGLPLVYIPNLRPSREPGNPMGRSDMDSAEVWLPMLGDAWTGWWRNIRAARDRMFIPEDLLSSTGRVSAQQSLRTRYFDDDTEAFNLANTDPADGMGMEVVSFAIRSEQYYQTVKTLLLRIAMSAGYAPQVVDVEGDMTAPASGTALRQRDMRSIRTVTKKRRYWTTGLRQLITKLAETDQRVYGQTHGDMTDMTVRWPEIGRPDANSLAQTGALLANARIASIDTIVDLLHPDWSAEDRLREVRRIEAESDLTPTFP